MASLSHITRCGLPGIDRARFGMQCLSLLWPSGQLIAAMESRFIAGLRGNQRCLWANAPPLPARDVVQALRAPPSFLTLGQLIGAH